MDEEDDHAEELCAWGDDDGVGTEGSSFLLPSSTLKAPPARPLLPKRKQHEPHAHKKATTSSSSYFTKRIFDGSQAAVVVGQDPAIVRPTAAGLPLYGSIQLTLPRGATVGMTTSPSAKGAAVLLEPMVAPSLAKPLSVSRYTNPSSQDATKQKIHVPRGAAICHIVGAALALDPVGSTTDTTTTLSTPTTTGRSSTHRQHTSDQSNQNRQPHGNTGKLPSLALTTDWNFLAHNDKLSKRNDAATQDQATMSLMRMPPVNTTAETTTKSPVQRMLSRMEALRHTRTSSHDEQIRMPNWSR